MTLCNRCVCLFQGFYQKGPGKGGVDLKASGCVELWALSFATVCPSCCDIHAILVLVFLITQHGITHTHTFPLPLCSSFTLQSHKGYCLTNPHPDFPAIITIVTWPGQRLSGQVLAGLIWDIPFLWRLHFRDPILQKPQAVLKEAFLRIVMWNSEADLLYSKRVVRILCGCPKHLCVEWLPKQHLDG